MEAKKIENIHVLQLGKGESVSGELRKYIKSKGIRFGAIHGIGALMDIEVGIIKQGTGNYLTKKFPKGELVSLDGNISWDNEDLIVHAHASFADDNYQMFGGHFIDATVSVKVELFIIEYSADINRKYDKMTKFKIWDI